MAPEKDEMEDESITMPFPLPSISRIIDNARMEVNVSEDEDEYDVKTDIADDEEDVKTEIVETEAESVPERIVSICLLQNLIPLVSISGVACCEIRLKW